jgi:Tol biopolymer transport system component
MKKVVAPLICCFLVIAARADLFAQATIFGQNKVKYRNFEWSYIQSSHFDVYFTQGGEYLAAFTADVAESSYAEISRSFRYQINNRVPIVVYNSHNDFQQTNVVQEYMEEGIGGVTEQFKNRVVIPFEGDYAKFRHVIHHELTHAVVNDMFYGGSLQSMITNNISMQLPMWFNEGLAEYESLGWDTNCDMFMRDATIHEYLLPINYLNGYFAYRGGQSIWYYIATKYGEEKIGEIMQRIRSSHNLDQSFRSALGLSIQELSDNWVKEQKVLYWPDIAKRQDPADFARRLTDRTKDGSFYNTSPTISPQGDKIAFISNRDDYFDVFVMNAIDGSTVEKIINGQTTADFEELHLLTPGMSWSPDGIRLAVTAKSGERDAIIILNTRTGHQDKYEFTLDGIFSMGWSPVEDKLVFIGDYREQSDLYTYNLNTKELTNITNDVFTDADPSWSPDGKTIYFSSDRDTNLTTGITGDKFLMQKFPRKTKDLYSIDVATKKIRRLTNLPLSDETSPAAAPDGKHLFFISDMCGINNIYVLDLDSDTYRPITNSANGVYQLSLSRDANKLAFSSLVNGGFDIFLMRTPLERNLKVSELEPTDFIRHLTAKSVAAVPSTANDSIALTSDVIIKTESEDTNAVFDRKMRTDFRNYVFDQSYGQRYQRDIDTTNNLAVTDNVDTNGNYIPHKYKLDFSPDIVYGNAGFNTFYGVQGSTVMAFSDMLGDHQIYLIANLLTDLKNSDFGVAYFYMPKRIDWGIQAYHSTRFILLDDTTATGSSVYQFTNYGLSTSASLPLSKYNRVEFDLSWMNLTRTNIDYTNIPGQTRNLYVPQISYIHDTALWGLISPANGERYNFTTMASPKIGGQALGFYSLLGDYRKYLKLGRSYTLALRLAGGGSFGEDPQRFIVGGVDNWINRQFTNNHIPLDSAEDFVFLTAGIPLRGYDYNARIGTKYLLSNTEFRFPFFGYFAAGPLPVFFESLSGVIFLDCGSAWNGPSDFRATNRDSSGNLYLQDLLVGTGYGVRMILMGFLVKLDIAYAYNLQGFSSPKYYFSLGEDF